MSPPDARGWLERGVSLVQPGWVAGHAPAPVAVGEGLWSVERRIRLPGGVQLPTRSYVVRAEDGGLAVLSPLPDDAARRDVAALGPVRWLVAPNSFHYGGLASWAAAFPQARVRLAPGLAARRPELPAGDALAEGAGPPFAAALAHAVFGPHGGVTEVAFLHRASATLILTDLCFHVCEAPRVQDRLALRALGAWRRFGPSRTARWLLLRDRAAVRDFVLRLYRWPFTRIAVAHGEPLEAGPEALRAAFRLPA